MKMTWVSLLIVLSIVLQSFVAVADSNQNHQLDAQHIQTQHSHELDHNTLFDDTSDSEHNIKDCHHCGHCQGAHNPWLTGKKTYQLVPELLVSNQYFYLDNLDESFIEKPKRPPIA